MSADMAINIYPESLPGEVKSYAYYATPGLKSYGSSVNLGTRGCWSMDRRTFRVSGFVLEEINTFVSPPTVTARGVIPNDGFPVTLVGNGQGGNQLMIVGGTTVHIFNLATNTFIGPIALPLTNAPVQGAFIDGYFLLTELLSIRVWFSALEDGTSWNALDFFARSHVSDEVVGLAVLRDRIWVFGSQTTEIFYDSGDLNTPFLPYPGSVIQEGASTPWGIVVADEEVYWLAEDNLGRGRINSGSNYSPTEISNPAIDFAIAPNGQNLALTEAYSYSQEGHTFIWWTFADGNTWCYDPREHAWHQRQAWDQATDTFPRWRARGACSTSAGVLVGDYATGSFYLLDLDTFTDMDQPRKWLRRAPYISSSNQFLFLDQIELNAQVAVGLQTSTQGALAQVMLRISRDAAQTWTEHLFASVGQVGDFLARCIWRHCGKARADRLVIEISQTDPVRLAWGPGLFLRITQGSGAL
jgi:hypothetical protein